MADEEKLREYLKRAIADAKDARRRLQESEDRAHEPVAIVGMACRYPGDVQGPQDLWRLVIEERDVISDFPTNRGWPADLYDPDPEHLGRSTTEHGGFLHDADLFDAEFFGMSPREAAAADPQQRLLLQTTWEALENAGIDSRELQGSRTGVFTGVMYQDYGSRRDLPAEEAEGYLFSGSAGSIASGRLAYTFGLEGPVVTVDTACSSSLVAIHLAANALRRGECDLAVAGGATVMSTPTAFIEFSRLRGLAPDGRCKSFSIDADGTGWAEGVGIVMLEKLSDAQRNGHRILAIVRGSAVNSDGSSNGLTAPNGPAQEKVIHAALAAARLTTQDVDLVEAHGTGTALGDPIEAGALLATYGRSRSGPAFLGSLKSNIGHSQAAAGVGGVIKVVLAMQNAIMPKTLHIQTPTPHVDWSSGSLQLLTEARPWPRSERPRRAAVSSFGFGGTNAHIVLEEGAQGEFDAEPLTAPVPWVLSARTPEALAAQAQRINEARPSSANDAFTLAARTPMQYRRAATNPAALLHASTVSANPGKLGFAFTGQGSQRAGMGLELAQAQPVFAEAFEEVSVAFGLDLKSAVFTGAGLDSTGTAQPALFSLEVALYRMLRSWGVVPDVLVGHSIGELAAAHAAGVMTLEDAVRLVTARGQLMQALPPGGAMLAIEAAENELELPEGVAVAAVNGPRSVVLSGEEAAVLSCASQGNRTQRLNVSHAFHSPRMDPMLAEFRAVAQTLTYREPAIPIISTVTGGDANWTDPEYWVQQVRATVRFYDALIALRNQQVRVLAEIGPDAVLTGLAANAFPEQMRTIALMRAHQPESRTVAAALGDLYTEGVSVDWGAYFPGAYTTSLPNYQFERKRYWLTPSARSRATGSGARPSVHPLLGASVNLADRDSTVLTGSLSVADSPWLADHQIEGVTVVPGAALAELVVRFGPIDELTVTTPMVLPTEDALDIQVIVDKHSVAIYSRAHDDEPWTQHGLATRSSKDEKSQLPVLGSWPPRDAVEVDVSGAYERLAERGYGYGPAFQGLRRVWVHDNDIFAEIYPDENLELDDFLVHPALLDAALHVLLPGVTGDRPATLPFAWNGIRSYGASRGAIRVQVTPSGTDTAKLHISDTRGNSVLSVDELVLRPFDRPAGRSGLRSVAWRPIVLEDQPHDAVIHRVAVGGDESVAVRARVAVHEVLGVLRDWVGAGGAGRLAVVLGEDLAYAGVRGLVRSAQAEYPGQFVLVDVNESAQDRALQAGLATGEPEFSVRGGEVLVPRLVPVVGAGDVVPDWGDGPVLVTGASGALGSVLARHLVSVHGVGELVLVSRRGAAAEGMDQLVAELTGMGADVEVVACDASDRSALQDVFERHRPTAVVHVAGVSSDGTLEGLSAEQVDAVLRPKVDAAWNLHELAGDVSAFVLYSSVAGVLGTAGQANYAAGNAFLDSLAQYRRDRGLAAVSLAWGLWELDSALSEALSETDRHRIERLGLRPLGTGDALEMFDIALTRPEPMLAITEINRNALGDRQDLPAVLRDLVRARRKPEAPLTAQAATTGLTLQDAARLVRREVAGVLGYSDPAGIDPNRPFTELGFDSLTAVELRNRLATATGLRLATTAVFDHPTVSALTNHLTATVSKNTAASGARPADDPIVIVGMACRFPGDVRSPEDLWKVVAEERDAISGFPTNRGWDLDSLYHPDPGHAGTSYTRTGGFLYDADGFDPEFFGMSPREALATDPQQRLLLETAWEVFERVGIEPSTLRGSSTGVFAGLMYHDYAEKALIPTDLEGYIAGGTAGSVASGRIAYVLGLEGPAITVDTACSSSLVALHLAAGAIQRGECEMALAGGAAVMSTPRAFVEFSRQRGLSPDGRCKPFAAAADGTGWSEGVGLLLLERQSAAARNGHRILAVVRGSAVNSDGASNGLTAPNGPAQERVMRRALADAGLQASDIDVIEAHGTGTQLGDPIEAHALLAVYGQRESPLWLGSLKSNIGHTQAAAGAGAIIKMVQAMENDLLPRTLHVDQPTPYVDWSAGNIALLTEAQSWARGERPRRAAVSAFGISGTNAHVILEEGPDFAPPEPSSLGCQLFPLVVSARTPEALQRSLDQIAATDAPIADLAFTLGTGRALWEYQAVTAARQPADVRSAEILPRGRSGQLAFVFTGQGAQRKGMGELLAQTFPAFADSLAQICGQFSMPLREAIRSGIDLDRTEITQPALFAIEVALFRLLESWGATPDMLAGHSIGEIAAAHVAGVLSLPDAVLLVTARAKLMQSLPPGGAMVSVNARLEELAPPAEVSIAAINGPLSVVLSGPEAAVTEYVSTLQNKSHRLAVSHAFHSQLMDPMMGEFRAVAQKLTYNAPRIAVVSTVTGKDASVDWSNPEYWVQQVRETVRFADAVDNMSASGATTFLEIGPDAVLVGLLASILPEGSVAIPLMRRDSAEDLTATTAFAKLHARGIPLNWSAFPANRTLLPTYPFERERYWIETGSGPEAQGSARHHEQVYEISWEPAYLPDTDAAEPTVVRVDSKSDPLETARQGIGQVLAELRARAFDDTQVVVLTPDPADPGIAAVWGLVRSVQAEAPGRIFLVGADHAPPSLAPVLAAGKSQVVFRSGSALVPKLASLAALHESPIPAWQEGPIHVTGGRAQEVANQLARWQIDTRPEIDSNENSDALIYTLAATSGSQLVSLTDHEVDEALSAIKDLWDTHRQITGPLVVISTLEGVVGAAGKALQASVSAFGSALAGYRRSRDLPGSSIVWSGDLNTLDAALSNGAPDLVAATPTDVRATNPGSPLLTEVSSAPLLADQLARLALHEQQLLVKQRVLAAVAAALSLRDPQRIDHERPFIDLGFDSLTGLDFRNRIAAESGLTLPATLVFDYPTPDALSAWLLGRLASAPAEDSLLEELDRFEALLTEHPATGEHRDDIGARLQTMLTRFGRTETHHQLPGSADELDTASKDELFDFIDSQLGRAAQ